MSDWVQWFCSMEGHDFFCEVDRSFMESRFNLFGLNQQVPTFSRCLSIILDYVSSDSDTDEVYRESWSRKECMDLYGRIHARFILTAHGQELMYQKYANGDFGTCPRYHCNKQAVLPIGLSETVGFDRVRTFCPKCHQIYIPPFFLAAKHVDGAYFGRTFPHALLLIYPELVEKPPTAEYVPTVYGYKLNKDCAAYKHKHLLDGSPENANQDKKDGNNEPDTDDEDVLKPKPVQRALPTGMTARRKSSISGRGTGMAIAGAATGGGIVARSIKESNGGSFAGASSSAQVSGLSTPKRSS